MYRLQVINDPIDSCISIISFRLKQLISWLKLTKGTIEIRSYIVVILFSFTFVTCRHSGSNRWLPQNNFGVDQRNIRRGLGHSTCWYHCQHQYQHQNQHQHHLILLDGSPRSVSGNWLSVRIWVSYLRPLTWRKFWNKKVKVKQE